MARASLTPYARLANVQIATSALPRAVAAATDALTKHGPTHPETLRAFEIVENHGATVHRQARILAGKSRGG